MSYFIPSPRVGRSQGASIFWGLISTCFAAAACFYFWENHKNERIANQMRDEIMQWKEQNETLTSQKEHLMASKAEAEAQLKTREELIQEKEAQLAQEETALEGMGRQTQNQSAQNTAQAAMVKKFNDVIRKIGKDAPPDVVDRAGRPVLRVPSAQLFAPGETALKPEGKALLGQIAQAVGGQLDNFEMRVAVYSDTDAEAQPNAPKKDPEADAHSASWDLTSARATALARYFRDQTQTPFLNVLVSGRGDAEPIISNAAEGHARNRRVEITVSPLPTPFHAPEADKAGKDTGSGKDKPKDKKSDKTPAH